jgi:hypothetical protein
MLLVVALIILFGIALLLYLVKSISFTGEVRAHEPQTDTYTLMSNDPACADAQQKGPWCYRSCLGHNNPLHYLCKLTGEMVQLDYDHRSVVVLCPKDANYFESFCMPVGIN